MSRSYIFIGIKMVYPASVWSCTTEDYVNLLTWIFSSLEKLAHLMLNLEHYSFYRTVLLSSVLTTTQSKM